MVAAEIVEPDHIIEAWLSRAGCDLRITRVYAPGLCIRHSWGPPPWSAGSLLPRPCICSGFSLGLGGLGFRAHANCSRILFVARQRPEIAQDTAKPYR